MEVFLGLIVIISGIFGFFLSGSLGILIGGIFGCLFYISVLLTQLWFKIEKKQLDQVWKDEMSAF